MPPARTPKTEPPAEEPAAAPEVDDRPAPTNVIEALARVMADIGGIRKLSAAQRRALNMSGGDEGIKYAYRGIDQLAQKAQPLLGVYGVVIVPEVLNRDTFAIVVNGNPWTDTFVEVLWRIYGPGGKDDMITSTTEGLGRDNSDKGINKAMTGAFKNLLLRIFCIGDPEDDTDGHTHEAGRGAPEDPTPLGRRFIDWEGTQRNASEVMFDRVKALAGTTVGDELKRIAKERDRRLVAKGKGSWLDDDEWYTEVDKIVTAAEASPPPASEAAAGEGGDETGEAADAAPTSTADAASPDDDEDALPDGDDGGYG